MTTCPPCPKHVWNLFGDSKASFKKQCLKHTGALKCEHLVEVSDGKVFLSHGSLPNHSPYNPGGSCDPPVEGGCQGKRKQLKWDFREVKRTFDCFPETASQSLGKGDMRISQAERLLSTGGKSSCATAGLTPLLFGFDSISGCVFEVGGLTENCSRLR